MQHEHRFATFIRALGKGPQTARSLTRDEAAEAMRMILAGQVEPVQLGAFLTLMRVKSETPAEVAGMAQTVQDAVALPAGFPEVRLDWPAYAGKRRRPPWFVLSALLLAANGIPVLMHGTAGYDPARVFLPEAMRELGVPPCGSLAQAAERIGTERFAFVPLSAVSPVLEQLILLRPLLGLRSPMHTVARHLNPARAGAILQGVFHPVYAQTHQAASAILGSARVAVFKGDGGEAERKPDLPCLVRYLLAGESSEEDWPATFDSQRHPDPPGMEPRRLAAVWRGETRDEYGEAAVVGTAAIALRLLGEVKAPGDAIDVARCLWRRRPSRCLTAA
ncbi:MAG TPA: glycosyl transferase family protein [Burkholderiaceae bacterium]